MTIVERNQRTWSDEYDGQFFRITSSCFSRSFCDGATALLASYDSDDGSEPIQAVMGTQPRPKPEEVFIFSPST